MKRVLGFIANELEKAGVQYHLLQNRRKEKTYPYFVGEIFPLDAASEDGKEEYTALLTGFDRSEDMARLLDDAEKIAGRFPGVEGKAAILGGQCIAAYASGPVPRPSGEEGLQKIEISLSVKSWKG